MGIEPAGRLIDGSVAGDAGFNGDIVRDGLVDAEDAAALLAQWGVRKGDTLTGRAAFDGRGIGASDSLT